MTIQNIEDVMERIMNLNKNLNEESLRTLLAASGWDKEDIVEGLHIFRSSAGNISRPQPVEYTQKVDTNIDNLSNQNEYTLNISPDVNKKSEINVSITEEKPYVQEINNSIQKEIPAFVAEEAKDKENIINKDIKDYSFDNYTSTDLSANENKSQNNNNTETDIDIKNSSYIEKDITHISWKRILSLILLFILLSAIAVYLFLGKNIDFNKSLLNRSNTNSQSYINDAEILYTDTNKAEFDNLRREIESLKIELSNYKNSTTTGAQTIVKYISQKGPKGNTGKGISSVSASSSGFVINYTDNSNSFIPYSTTTLLEILNAKELCFRDQNANIASSSDACLDKTAILNLLNR